jgi:drug/metabolite transporter (DMT)-like permease
MTGFLVVLFTLIAFAANSLLCRVALGRHLIDPVSFTTVRLASGAVALWFLLRASTGSFAAPATKASRGTWGSGLALFVYAGAFSLAYLSLSTGTGALILFGMVQVTMLGAALKSGERPGLAQSIGIAAAILGLVYLVLPGISAPDPGGALLMALAGVAWGVYSIRGRGATSPASMTAGNFLRSVPPALVASAVALPTIHGELAGLLLALVSGVVTSGLGYVLWYRALKNLTTTQASVVQLVVPVLAAFGGVVFLSEQVSTRLVAASALILGGVATTLVRGRAVPRRT